MFTMKAFDVGGRRKRRVAILLVCIVISLLLWLLQPPGGIGSRVPRIVYYNTHKGTRANMESIASRLELYLTHFDPSTLEGNVLASSQTAAQRLVDTGWANRFCANVDIVVIGDFFGYARPLLQSLFTSNESNRCTGAFFVAELTNRFNWNVTETGDLFAALAWNATRAGRLVWVENNPFEARHLADQAFITPEFRLMRPMGASNIEPLTLSAEDASLVAIFHDGKEFSPLRYVMEQLQVPHKVLRRKYGGARTLAKYKAVVELPYQVSTMKFYENLAAGVVMLIPSPAFYQELVLKNIVWLIPDNYFFRTGQPGDGPDWAAYMDYYHPTFTDYIYYFDSWEQLCDMASKDVIDVKNVRERAPVFYETVRHKTLNGWANLFNSFGFDVRVDGKKPTPDESAQGYKVLVPDAFQSNPEPSSLQEYKAAYESLKPWHAIRTDNLITLKFKAKKRLSSLDFGAAEYRRYLVHIPGDGVFKAFSPKFDSDASLRHLLDYLITVESSLSSSESLNLQPFAKEGLIQLLQMASTVTGFQSISSDAHKASLQIARIIRILHTLIHHIDLAPNSPTSKKLLEALSNSIFTMRSHLAILLERLSRRLYFWIYQKYNDLDGFAHSNRIDRGIVLVTDYDDERFRHTVLTIQHLRKNVNCSLPIQVFHNGKERLSSERVEELQSFSEVEVINLQDEYGEIMQSLVQGVDHVKPFALLASMFKRVIFVDRDFLLLQNPDIVLNTSQLFQRDGVLLHRVPVIPKSKGGAEYVSWLLGGKQLLSASVQGSPLLQNLTLHEGYSGFMAFDKSKIPVLHGLLVASHMNRRTFAEHIFDWVLESASEYGDQDSYWIGMEVSGASFEFAPGPSDLVGTGANPRCGALLYRDESGSFLGVRIANWNHRTLLSLDMLFSYSSQSRPYMSHWVDSNDSNDFCAREHLGSSISSRTLPMRERKLIHSFSAFPAS